MIFLDSLNERLKLVKRNELHKIGRSVDEPFFYAVYLQIPYFLAGMLAGLSRHCFLEMKKFCTLAVSDWSFYEIKLSIISDGLDILLIYHLSFLGEN